MLLTAAAGAEKVVLSKFAWSVPIVQPHDVRKVNIYKGIAANNVIPSSFSMRQSLPQEKSTVWPLGVSSAAIFDHCNLRNMQVWANHSRYHSVDMATDFTNEQYAGVYKSFYDFSSRI